MIKWVKKLFYIVKNYSADVSSLRLQINNLEKILRDRTDISVDVSASRMDANHIIVVGRYKNIDYVQTFSLQNNDIGKLIDQLKEMERYGEIRKVDCPPPMRAVFKKG